MERAETAVGGPVQQGADRSPAHHAAVRNAWLLSRVPLVRNRDEAAEASRRPAAIPERRGRRREVPLSDRDSPAARVPLGPRSAYCGTDIEFRAQRGVLLVATDVPRTGRRRSGLHCREALGVGPHGAMSGKNWVVAATAGAAEEHPTRRRSVPRLGSEP